MPGKSNHPRIKELLFFNLLTLSLLILSTRLATVLHEAAGHALVALLSGGKVFSISVSLFGGGFTRASLGNNVPLARFLFSLSGIVINILTGTIVLFFVKRPQKVNLYAPSFWTLFAISSLSGAFAYLTLGLYYQSGDPVTWAAAPPSWYLSLWIFLLPFAPVISFILLKAWLSVQERVFPSMSFQRRLWICLVTLGVSGGIYALFFFSTHQTLASSNAPAAAYERSREEVIAQKRQALFAQLRAAHPQLTDQEIEALAEKTVIMVNPAEVPQRFPLIPVLTALFLAGGWLALKRQQTGMTPPMPEAIGFLKPIGFLFLATAVLALLIWTGGYIYPWLVNDFPMMQIAS